MNRQFILEGWNSFRREIVGDAPASVLKNLRRVFFAGATHMFVSLFLDESDSELDDDARFQAISREIRAFARNLNEKEARLQ